MTFDKYVDVAELPRPLFGFYTHKRGCIVLCKDDAGWYVVHCGKSGRLKLWSLPLKKKTAWARFVAAVNDDLEKT